MIMFKSAYGVIDDLKMGFTHLIHKAINVQEGVQIYEIGFLSGETVPFNGKIYIVEWKKKQIPFISKREAKLGTVTFDQFNQNEFVKNRRGEINVTSFEISHIGFNLKEFSGGPRGWVNYFNVFSDENFHGYQFEDTDEYAKVISFIKDAIPVLRFNDYKLLNSSPSVCIDVHLEQNEPTQLSGSTLSQKIESIVRSLNENIEDSTTFWQFLEDYSEPALTIEELTEKLIDIERVIFYMTTQAYPLGFWNYQKLIDLLKATYFSYLSKHYPNFEQFLIAITNLIRDRYYGRLIFEQYPPCTALHY